MNSGSSSDEPGSADDPTPAEFACSSKTQTAPRWFFCYLGTQKPHQKQSARYDPIGLGWTLGRMLITFDLGHWTHSNRRTQQVTEATSHCQSRHILVLYPHPKRSYLLSIFIPIWFDSTIHLFNSLCFSLQTRLMILWQCYRIPFLVLLLKLANDGPTIPNIAAV